jgi:RelA/SpoT family (p)ppGpp synthetase
LNEGEVAQVRDAYRFSDESHLGQFRASGDPYISHPLAVADICSGWRLDVQALMAALLHDVMEDQGIRKAELLERFGPQVADLVDGLSKLDKLEFQSQEDAQAENFRKMLLAMSRDVRVILVKLADRLHNMRTLDAVQPVKRRRIARETLEIYAPIAHRLGLNQVFRELQDLSFANFHPMRYATLRKAVLAARGNRREIVHKILESVKAALPAYGIEAEVQGREKALYGIYRKMREKHLSFSEVLDVYGFRVVVKSQPQCYLALGSLHALYKPVPGKFKDYIAIPKLNGYQSLHTTLIGPFGIPVEFQIRTQEMHHIAETGVASHWLYKADDASLNDLQKRTHVWLQSLLDLQSKAGDATEFLETVKIDLFPDAVYVFTPKSKIVSLPRGATPIDFAYQIHTDIGNHAVGARVNGINVPLRTELHSGDVVEVMTAPSAKPSPNWLAFVRTAKARFEVRHSLRTTSMHESIALGEQMLGQALAGIGADINKLGDAEWDRVLRNIGLRSREELFADIGLGRRIAAVTARRITGGWGGGATESGVRTTPGIEPPRVVVRGTEGMAVQLSPCCSPIPGDDIVGYLRKGDGMIVHATDCRQAVRMRTKDPEWWIDDVGWADDVGRSFETRLEVSVHNERGALGRVAAQIAIAEANITRVMTEELAGGGNAGNPVTLLHLSVQVSDRNHLAAVMRALRQIPEVVRVQRPRG